MVLGLWFSMVFGSISSEITYFLNSHETRKKLSFSLQTEQDWLGCRLTSLILPAGVPKPVLRMRQVELSIRAEAEAKPFEKVCRLKLKTYS